MEPQLIIMIVAGLLTLGLLGVFVVMQRGKDGPSAPDYRMLFILGISSVPVGITTGNVGLWGMGVALLVIGLANRDKWADEPAWSELSAGQRRIKLVLILGLAALLGLGVLAFVVAGGGRGG